MKRPSLNDLDLPLVDLMAQWPETIEVFRRHQMLCVGCLVGPFHTIIDACAEYGLEVDAFTAELAASVTAPQLK